MNYQAVLTHIKKHIALEESEEVYLTSLLHEKYLNRKQKILKQGESCPAIYFVEQGILRAFHLTQEGKEVTIMFAISNWWITDMCCFLNGGKATVSIEALEKSTVWRLFKDDLEDLYVNVPKFERFFRILMQNAYVREQTRTQQNLSLPAEERYSNFIQKYPQILTHISQKQLASYLGITPEFLSKIRNRRNVS